jgi:phytoene synthase
MVKEPDRLLSLAYAGATVRPRLEAAFALDSALADVLRTVRESMIARIRLAWWREQIEALANGGATAPEPILTLLAARFAPADLSSLSALPDAWDNLLEDPLNLAMVERFASGRAEALASVFHAPQLTKSLAFWSLVDFAFHCSEAQLAADVRASAARLAPLRLKGLPRAVRVLVGLARDDLAQPDRRFPGSPARLLRAFRHAFLTS